MRILPANWRHTSTYLPATSPVCKMSYFVARLGLVGLECALKFLGCTGLGIGLRVSFGCMSSVDIICKYVYMCLCVWMMFVVDICQPGSAVPSGVATPLKQKQQGSSFFCTVNVIIFAFILPTVFAVFNFIIIKLTIMNFMVKLSLLSSIKIFD